MLKPFLRAAMMNETDETVDKSDLIDEQLRKDFPNVEIREVPKSTVDMFRKNPDIKPYVYKRRQSVDKEFEAELDLIPEGYLNIGKIKYVAIEPSVVLLRSQKAALRFAIECMLNAQSIEKLHEIGKRALEMDNEFQDINN